MVSWHYVFVLPLAWLMYSWISLAINRKRASKMNLRVVMSPVDNINTLWIATQKFLIPLIKRLPFGLGSFLRYNHRGWQYRDQDHMHQDLGDAWVHTTPVQNQLYVANAEVAQEIFSRRRDFVKPIYFYKLLDIFGKNANTVEGRDWLRHRRVTASPLNERNNSLVWAESLRQAREMLAWWTEQNSKGINTTDKDVRTLALHVLIGAVFGRSYPFLSIMDPPDPGFTMNYRDALRVVLENFLLVLLLPSIIIYIPFAPKKLAKVAAATSQFRRYMKEMLNKEKQRMSDRESDAGNLMSCLVKASAQERAVKGEDGDPDQSETAAQGLSDSEIIGNLFLYHLAGHETTGNTLSYSILLLAAHPEVQEWVAQEVRYVLRDQGSSETWDYDLFNRFKRCLAVMLETLRIYPSVGSIPKYTNDREQSLAINGKTHIIPPKTLVFLNSFAMHKMPRYWGPDSLVWRPSRWIISSSSTTTRRTGDADVDDHQDIKSVTSPSLDTESILEPQKGTYMPWSDGPRACPGKKFAQVEFVAVLISLLRHHRVRPTVRDGESEEKARRRILDVVNDSAIFFTLQMRRPAEAMVSWVKDG